MRGPVAYRLRGGSRRLWRQFQSEHGPTAPGTLFAERSCARSSTSGDVCIRRRSALRWVQGHRRSRLCVCEGVAPIMGAGSTRGRPAGVGTGRPGRKTRGLLHVCGVRKLRFDETAPFCTTDELKQPVRGERTFGSGCPGCNRRSGLRVRLHRWSCYVFEHRTPGRRTRAVCSQHLILKILINRTHAGPGERTALHVHVIVSRVPVFRWAMPAATPSLSSCPFRSDALLRSRGARLLPATACCRSSAISVGRCGCGHRPVAYRPSREIESS